MSAPGLHRAAWIGVLGLAVILRFLRLLARWHEDAWLYAAYPSDTVDAVSQLQLPGFTGLHPPAWPLLHTVSELLLPVPMLWLGSSALLSIAAVVLLCRRSLLAGLVLASAPLAVHYAAEVNQYALLTFALAGLWSRPSPSPEARLDLPLLAWGALAGWTHILGAVAVGVTLFTLPSRLRARSLLGLGLLFSPLLLGVLGAAQEPSTFSQPPLLPALVLEDWVRRFGLGGLLLTGLLLSRVERDPAWTTFAGSTAAIAIFIGIGVAAPHQFSYWLVPLVALATRAPRARAPRLVLLLCLVQASWQAAFDMHRVHAIVADVQQGDRAIDLALGELSEPWTCAGPPTPDCSGDALVLLRPPGRNDDDKTRTSPVLWRLRPWWSAPRVRPSSDFEWSDYREGQPRTVQLPTGPHVVYVHDHLRPSLARLTDAHRRVWIVVSEPGPHREYTVQLQALLDRSPTPVGPDRLYRLAR